MMRKLAMMKKIDKELGIIEADQGRSDIAGPIITHQDYGDVNDARKYFGLNTKSIKRSILDESI